MRTYHRLVSAILVAFVIVQIFSTAVYGYGSSSTSGGGIGGALMSASKDFYGNMFKHETREKDLIFNKSVKYSFSAPELSIYEVWINGKSNEMDISVRVEDLINTSKYINKPAPGIIYRNENVWIGTKRINYVAVRFKVNNSWMEKNGLNNDSYPHLLKWDGEKWSALKTDIISSDDTYTYFEAPKTGSSSISLFAISGPPKSIKKSANFTPINITGIEGINEEVVSPDQDEIYVAETEKSPGFDTVIATIGILLSVMIIRKYKHGE